MIVKKIPRLAGKSAGSRIREVKQLIEYFHSPEKPNAYANALLRYLKSDKVAVERLERSYHHGARNLISLDPETRKVEMMAVVAEAKTGEPLAHWLLSWKHSERPTPEQIDEAAEIFLTEMGWGHLPAIYAAHADTHNIHLHVAVNRFDAVRGKMVDVEWGKRWDLNASHRAVAIIVDRQGWEAERNARYIMVDGEPVMRHEAEAKQRTGETSVDTKARAYEQRTGLKSAMRIMIDEARPILLEAKSWAEIHFRLGEIGMRCVPARDGLKIALGGQEVKASSIHRRCSLKKLEQRLDAPFKERLTSVEVVKRALEVEAMPDAVGALEYRRWQQSRAHELGRELAAIDEKRDLRIEAAERQRNVDLSALANLNDSGRSIERVQLEELINEKAATAVRSAKRCRDDEARRARADLRAAADLEQWLRRQREHDLAERWRKRHRLEAACVMAGAGRCGFSATTVDGFESRAWEGCTLWSRAGRPTAFLEFEDRVEMVTARDPKAILAAYQVASRKFGEVTLKGDPGFISFAAAVIVKAGLGHNLSDPLLRPKTIERSVSPELLQRSPVARENNRDKLAEQPSKDGSVSIEVQKAFREGGIEKI